MNSISDFLETYGWILFVAGIVGIEIFAELQGSEGVPDYVDTGEQFLEENVNGYTVPTPHRTMTASIRLTASENSASTTHPSTTLAASKSLNTTDQPQSKHSNYNTRKIDRSN